MVTSLAGSYRGGRPSSGLCCVSARLGTLGGVVVGALTGIVLTVVTATSDGASYAAGLGLWLFGISVLFGGAAGLLVGAINGTFLRALALTRILRNRSDNLSQPRVSAAAFLISGLCSFALLSILLPGSPGLIYPLTGAAALLAVPLSRKLPLDHRPGDRP